MRSGSAQDIVECLIPLPHEVAVTGSRRIDVASVRLSCEPPRLIEEPRVATALRLLGEAGVGGQPGTETLLIRCRLAEAGSPLPAPLREIGERLAGLPNPAQAYAIVPDGGEPERLRSLTLLARTPLGILYAARTLCQMLKRGAGGELEVPCASVVDWPDIGERGQWGGNTHDEVALGARWKLNVIEESAGISVDSAGRTRLALEPGYVEGSHDVGVTIVPYILHIEQVALYAGLMSRADITSTPDPSKPLPGEYVPGLCMSAPATARLVGDWMESIARFEQTGAIEVWLSEDRSPCFCDRCRGREPFELEVRCIEEAFRRARERRPELKLRILLTQGSYPVNDRVIAAAGRDVQITYYDGGRTYDSSHAPMIYPLLEDFARSGRWLGVYPQITHCWRTVFPFTAPQLIRARATEFADKGLSNVIGYAVPSNRHHEFNVMALAEWTWNSRGRSPEELARAYARSVGMADPALYARWAVAVGEAGWWLAESRIFLRFIYNCDLAADIGGAGAEDHRFRHAGLMYDRPTIEGALARATEARELAAGLDAAAIDESDAVHAGLAAILCLDTLMENAGRDVGEASRAALDRLDRAAAVVCRSVSSWGERVNATLPATSPARGSMWVRLRDTANVLLRVCDSLRSREPYRSLPDPYARFRDVPLGKWQAGDFASDRSARFSFDVTELLPEEAPACFACFWYDEGHYAAEIRSVSLHGGVEAASVDCPMRVGRWERWHEIKVALPPGSRESSRRVHLEIDLLAVILEGGGPKVWECRGRIGLRVGWPAAARLDS